MSNISPTANLGGPQAGNLVQYSDISDPNLIGPTGSVRQSQRLANRIKIAVGAMPGLASEPTALLSLATSGLDDVSLAHQASSMTAAADMDAFIRILKNSSPQAQRYMWSTLTTQQQRAASQLGYGPPDRHDDSWVSGVLSPVMGPLATGIGATVGAIQKVVEPVIGPALEGLTWVADQPAHAYRAIATDESAMPWLVGIGALAGGLAAAPFTGGLSLGLTAAAIGGAGIAGATAGAAVTNPGDWWDAYSSSWDGERTFKPSAQRQARVLLGQDQVMNLAKDVAWASSPLSVTELATEMAGVSDSTDPQVYERSLQRVADQAFTPGTAQHEAFYGQLRQLVTDPEFRKAVTVLQEGKVSPGRDLAENIGLDPSSGWGRVVSGGTDALWVITLDPTLAVAKTAEAWKLARYGVATTMVDGRRALDSGATVAKMRDLYETDASVARAYDTLGRAVTESDYTLIKMNMPHAESLYLPLRDWAQGRKLTEVTGRDVLDFFGDSDQLAKLLGGRGLRAGEQRTLIPHLNRAGSAWAKTKFVMGEAIDAGNDADLVRSLRRYAEVGEEELRVAQIAALPEAVARRLGYASDLTMPGRSVTYNAVRTLADLPIVGVPARKAGSLAEGLTTMIPTGVIDLTAANKADQIDRLSDLQKMGGMTSTVRHAWRDFILEGATDAQQMSAISQMLETSFQIAGMDRVKGGQELIDTFVGKFRQVYARGSDATVLSPFGEIPVGKNIVLDQAREIPFPDLNEMRRAVQRSGLLHDVLGVADSELVTTAMNRYWKPAVLLRIGFIPRAAGEELLAFVARNSLSQYAQTFGARALGQEQVYRDAESAFELMGKGGLSPRQSEILDRYRYLAHVRPVERIAQRVGFNNSIVQRTLGHYTDFVRSTLREGLAPGFTSGLPERWRTMLAPDETIRGMLMRGVPADLADAAKAWEHYAAASVMREVSAGNTGPWAQDFVGKGYGKMVRKVDPKTGEITDAVMLPLRGRFERYYAEKDPLFMSALHEEYSRAIDDPFQQPAIIDFFSRYLPDSLDEAKMGRALDDLNSLGEPGLRQLIVEASTGEPTRAHVQRALEAIKGEAARDAVARALPLGDYTAESIMEAARAGVMATVEAGGLRDAAKNTAFTRLTAFLDGLEPNDRRQVSVLLHANHGNSEGVAWARQSDLGRILRDGLHDQAGRPEWTETLTRSHYSQYSPQGFPVANAPARTDVRLYVPVIDNGTLAALSSGSSEQTLEGLLTRLHTHFTDTNDTYALSRWEHVEEWAKSVIAGGPEALASMSASAANLGFGVIPVTHVAFDDPRLARSVTNALNPASEAIGYADVPNRVRRFRTGPEFGVHRPMVDDAGHHAWHLQSEEIQGRMNLVPTDTPFTEVGAHHYFTEVPGYDTPEAVDGFHDVVTQLRASPLSDDERRWVDDISTHYGYEGTGPMSPDEFADWQWDHRDYEMIASGAHHDQWAFNRQSAVDWESLKHISEKYKIGVPEWRPGVSFESAVAERMDRRAGELEQMFRAGVQEDRLVPTSVREEAYDDAGELTTTHHSGIFASDRTEMAPGTPVNTDQVFVDSVGNPIPTDQIPWNYALRDNGDRPIMSDIFGPMVMDAIDDSLGRVATVDGARVLRSDVGHVIRSPGTDLPNVALGPMYANTYDQTGWDKIVRFGFGKVIGPSIDAIIRKPMAFHNFARSYGTIVNDIRWLRNPDLIDALDTTARDLLKQRPNELVVAGNKAAQAAGEGTVTDHYSLTAWLRAISPDGKLSAARAELEVRGAELARRGDLAGEAAHNALARDITKVWADPAHTTGDQMLHVWREVVPDYAQGRSPLTWSRKLKDEVAREAGPLASTFLDPRTAKLLHAGNADLVRVEEQARDMAVERAISDTVPFIDSHKFRSQFADSGRNLLPFWYAEENFLKRWGKTLRLAPQALERGRLAYQGMKSTGIIRTDSQGRDWFVYPGSGLLVEALGKLPFVGDVLPVGTTFQTKPSAMLPGFQRFGAPNVAPVVSVPMDYIAQQFPEMADAEKALVGSTGVNKGIVKAFLPSSVTNLYEAFTADEGNTKFASAMMSAAQILMANGEGPPEGASDLEMEDFMRKLRDHARTVLVAQAFTGTIVPGAPTAVNTGGGNSIVSLLTGADVTSPADVMSEQYRTLVRNLGIDAGTVEYLRLHPQSTPWQTFSQLSFGEPFSKSPSGARVPITADSVSFYESNQQWMHDSPNAGPWFIPPQKPGTPAADQVDRQAYDALLSDELRVRQSPDEFVRSMYFRASGQQYFAASAAYKDELNRAGKNITARQQIQTVWDRWKTTYLAAHPVLATELQSGEGRVRRQKTITEMTAAVNDPLAPQAWHTPNLGKLQRSYDRFKTLDTAYGQNRTNVMQRRQTALRQQFSDWAAKFVLNHPEVEPYWSTVLAPESNLD